MPEAFRRLAKGACNQNMLEGEALIQTTSMQVRAASFPTILFSESKFDIPTKTSNTLNIVLNCSRESRLKKASQQHK